MRVNRIIRLFSETPSGRLVQVDAYFCYIPHLPIVLWILLVHMITCIDVGIRNAMICDVALCENISLNILIIEPHAAEV